MRVVKSTPEKQHADQDKCRENDIPDKVHPMDALTATKASVFVIDIKTIPALLHLTNQLRQKSSTVSCLSQPTDQWICKKSYLYRCTVSLGSATSTDQIIRLIGTNLLHAKHVQLHVPNERNHIRTAIRPIVACPNISDRTPNVVGSDPDRIDRSASRHHNRHQNPCKNKRHSP